MGWSNMELADMTKRRSVILRLPEAKYQKLKHAAAVRTVEERVHVSMQRVLEGLVDLIPDSLPRSSEKETEEVP